MVVSVDVLGPVRIRGGGTTDPLTRSMEIGVLSVLALNAGSAVSGHSLISVLWPRDPPRTAGKTLQGYVKRVRALVAAHGVELTYAGPAGYVLRLAPDQVDAIRFESMITHARAGDDDARRLRELDQALALWRGDPFAGCELDGLAPYREWLLGLRSGTRVEHAATRIRLGVGADTISTVRAQLVDEPTNERLWLHLAGALYLSGNPVAALDAITEARHELDERVGVGPGPELRELQRRMLQHDDVEGAYRRLTGPERPVRARSAGPSGRGARKSAGPPIALSLPRWAGELVDPDGLVPRIAARLDEGPAVITVCGPGGLGKTRCAVEAAQLAATPCRGFIDLSSFTTAAELLLHLSGSFGVPDRDDPVSAVAIQLGDARCVVVLDNLEQIGDAAPAIRELSGRCPSVTWLLTSQTELGIDGERVVRLRPLAHSGAGADRPSPAAALLVAAAARRGLRLDADAGIERIAGLLGGIPLALELAAGQLQHLRPEALLGALADPIDALVDPRRLVDRHRSMRACFELGLARLGPDAVDLFSVVSHRPNGCRFDDLMTWWGRPTAFPRAVAELVEAGFATTVIDLAGATRITQIPLVRAFGRTLPRPPDAEAADKTLDLAVVGRAQASMTEPRALVTEPDLADIRRMLQAGLDHPEAVDGALQLAVLLMLYWWTARITEGRRWLAALLAQAGDRPSPVVGVAVHVLSLFDFYVGDAEGARRRLDAGLDTKPTDPLERARLLALRAMLDACEDDHATATGRSEQAVALARAAGDQQALAYALGNAGDVATAAGDFAAARGHYVECVDGMRRGGLNWLSAAPHARLGDLDLSDGELGRARMWFDRAVALWSARELGPGAPQTLAGLARLDVIEGDHASARRHLDAALATAEQCGSRGEYPWVVLGYAALLAATDRRADAAVLFELGLRHGRAAGHHVRRLVEAELAGLYRAAVPDPGAVRADPRVLTTPLEDLPMVVAQVLAS
ncbi:BTAD domain-containing putative transcriptional regulator [Actinoplanes sp. NPDC049265]|uniref:AfsR/SARP family transcriptional regulator n=1 Tax=Actinoplanes sp. NPDC049265 TaxID=3363902 RepID=UPI003722B8D5